MSTVTGQQQEMVLVPRKPTKEMLDAAWAESNEENAEGVWRDMLEAWELSRKNGEID